MILYKSNFSPIIIGDARAALRTVLMGKEKSKKFFIVEVTASLVLLFLGILFVAAPKVMENYVLYVIAGILLAYMSLYLYLRLKTHKTIYLVETVITALLAGTLIEMSILFKGNPEVVDLTVGAYCVLKGARNIVSSLGGRSYFRTKLVLTINTLTYFILALAIFISVFKGKSSLSEILVIYGVLYIIEGAITLYNIISRERRGTLLKILDKTYAKEILSGLILAIITASFLLVLIEPKITSFGDGIWYCFALVTTIGFGDIAAETSLGRLISVAIGLYGIVVVSLITSIIVNIYSENKDKEQSKDEESKP